ncbi:unnamed protein product [Ectocarpus sp. 4 AP-2014]
MVLGGLFRAKCARHDVSTTRVWLAALLPVPRCAFVASIMKLQGEPVPTSPVRSDTYRPQYRHLLVSFVPPIPLGGNGQVYTNYDNHDQPARTRTRPRPQILYSGRTKLLTK